MIGTIAGLSALSGGASALALAQGFEILGKGVEITGGTYRQQSMAEDRSVEDNSSAARDYRFKPFGTFILGSWLDGGKEPSCPVNGVPTPRATVYSKRGTHAAQYSCDKVRTGTTSKFTEEQWSFSFQSRAAATGRVITLSATHVTTIEYANAEGAISARFKQLSNGRTLFRLRIGNGACQVLERIEVFESSRQITTTSGKEEHMQIVSRYVNEPPATCRLLD